MHSTGQNTWVFGYGSLIWRPGFAFIASHKARLNGWRRVFWQGSHDHRGTPEVPGRVVTLVPDKSASCVGMIYLIEPAIVSSTFEALDHREKNGYDRIETTFSIDSGSADNAREVNGIVYIANQHNEAYLGEASTAEIAAQILTSVGPSGANIEYLYALADAIRDLDAEDEHVFELEKTARALNV